MSNATDNLRTLLEPMSLDTVEVEPFVALRRDEFRAMLDVIDIAESFCDESHDGPRPKLRAAFAWLRAVAG